MTLLLALDPGGTTGWSTWFYDATTPLRHIEHGMIPGGKDGFIDWALRRRGEFDEVVAESFALDGRTAQPDITPIRIETAIDLIFGRWGDGCPVYYQRNVMKAHAPDSLLKRLDLWWPGEGHDRDSGRHAIARQKTARHAPTLRWLGGSREAA
jgi:hypothetical protein